MYDSETQKRITALENNVGKHHFRVKNLGLGIERKMEEINRHYYYISFIVILHRIMFIFIFFE